MKTTRRALLLGFAIATTLAKVAAQEMLPLLAEAAQFDAADQGGTGAVVTGPEADPRPRGVGPSGQSGSFQEPWEEWVQQPVAAPLVLEVNVKAAIGTQVTISLAGQNYNVAGVGLDTESPTNRFYPNLKAHQPCSMGVSGPNWEYIKIVFKGYTPRQLLYKRGPRAIPRPFKAMVDGEELIETEGLAAELPAGNNSTNWLVEVRPDRGLRPVFHRFYEEVWSRDEDSGEQAPGDGQWLEMGPGRSASASSGAFRWSVSLGRLWTGLTAGKIRLCEQLISSNLYSGLALSYVARSTNQSELHVVTNANGSLRQIKAPQALVDIQSTWSPTQECVLRFYIRAHVGAFTNGTYQILTNSPFMTWRLRNPDSPGTYSRFQVVEQRPSSRTHVAELSYSNSVWQLGYGTGNEARTERRTVSINGSSRQETVQIMLQTNVVYKAAEGYLQFAWGWELTNVVTNPDGNALTNRFIYYTDPSVPAAYARLKERWFPGGRWELYCYPYVDEYGIYRCAGWPTNCGDFAEYPGNKDAELIRMRPWKDGPASPAAASLTNVVVTESYRFPQAVGAHESHRTTELVFRDNGPVILDLDTVGDGDYLQPEDGDAYWAHDWHWRGQVNDKLHTYDQVSPDRQLAQRLDSPATSQDL
ncbi:MAG: hypothetical protein ACP5MD_01400 [Verrucomicrobiia bacterium]